MKESTLVIILLVALVAQAAGNLIYHFSTHHCDSVCHTKLSTAVTNLDAKVTAVETRVVNIEKQLNKDRKGLFKE